MKSDFAKATSDRPFTLRSLGVGGLAIITLAAHVFFSRGAVRHFSVTYDEPVHVTAGFVAWKTGQMRFNGYHHPPLGELWAALPLVFTGAIVPMQDPAWIRQRWSPADQYQFADRFLYHNRVSASELITRARWMQVALTMLLIILISLVAWRVAGVEAGVLALVFASLSPTLLAHGAIVSTDLMFATWFFGLFASFLFLEKKWGVALTGVALGSRAVSKYFFWGVVPIVGAIFAYEKLVIARTIGKQGTRLSQGHGRLEIASAKRRPRNDIISLLTVLGIAFVVITVVCRPDQLDLYWLGLKSLLTRAQAGRSSFLLGEHRVDGWLIYFPYLFLVKSSLAELAALIVAVTLILRRKFRLPSFLWIPPLVFFAMACVSKVQIGHRYILAVYPFLFVAMGVGLSKMEPPLRRISLAAILLGAALFTAIRVNPFYLSYFNPLAARPGYDVSTDSNVDWGQGLNYLSESLSPDDKLKGIYLCYFGTADPHYSNIKYLAVASDTLSGHMDDSADKTLAPTTFAISATHYQSTYYADKDLFGWLRAYTPRVVADSILVYDFSAAPEALQRLRALRPPS